ncbi:MAG: hypothetical protein ACK5NG_01915 [Chthoniobacterales bacterium]
MKLFFESGHCSLAMNRRKPDPENPGRVQRRIAPNPDGVVDHEDKIHATIQSLFTNPTKHV